MTLLTQQAPPDQPMPPLIAELEGSSIHLSWVNLARPNGLPGLFKVLCSNTS